MCGCNRYSSIDHCQPPPVCRKARRIPLLTHRPQLACTRCASAGQLEGAASIVLVELVHRVHEAHAVFRHHFIKVQRQLFPGGGLQIHQHHAGFGVLEAGAVDVFQDGARGLRDVRAVAGGRGQGDACAAAVLGVFFSERAGADEGHDVAGVAVLFAQFFGGTAGKFGDGFLQILQFGDGVAE